MQTRVALLLTFTAIQAFTVVMPAAAQEPDSKSLDKVNKELSNAISSIKNLQLAVTQLIPKVIKGSLIGD